MKKVFFGYKVSEVDLIINTLREENESLNATITTLKTQIKNSDESSGAKANLVEADLKKLEENLKQLNNEKNENMSLISSLSEESEVLRKKNEELTARIEHLNMQNENLELQLADSQQQSIKQSDDQITNDIFLIETLQSQLNTEKEYKITLEKALNGKVEELTAVTSELEKSKETEMELEIALAEINRLKRELAISEFAVNEQRKMKAFEKQQQENMNQASEVSLRAYYEMSKIRNEVVEYMQERMKEYYQLINENSVKISAAIEQHQLEYNQMIREFFTKAYEYRVSLSNIEDDYSNMTDFSLNIDKIANRMNEIMNKFVQESNSYLKNAETNLTPSEMLYMKEETPVSTTEDSAIRPLVFKISGK